jgi:hypothetical protein
MATAIGVMDRAGFDADTDVLVVVDPPLERLLWVPRDLWCERIEDRVNAAFKLGGHPLLIAVLAEHGLAVANSVCLDRRAAEAGLRGLTVEVPVSQRLEFWYPLAPQRPIEEGRKRVVFEPPAETLSGERIHQWIGARYRVAAPGSDLDRIGRQQVLVRALLRKGFGFGLFIAPDLPVRVSNPEAIEEIARVRPGWRFETLSNLEPVRIQGKEVLRRYAQP